MPSLIETFRYLFAAFFVGAGVMHFVAPRGYARMIPKALPAHKAIVVVSGVAEIALGVLLLVPLLRLYAVVGVIALLVAVFPANVNMAVHHISPGKKPVAPWLLWARLPLQAVLIAWAWLVR